jgi:hypothetical protein
MVGTAIAFFLYIVMLVWLSFIKKGKDDRYLTLVLGVIGMIITNFCGTIQIKINLKPKNN